jgi:hypothetical protein
VIEYVGWLRGFYQKNNIEKEPRISPAAKEKTDAKISN